MKTYVWALYASLLLYSCGANSTNRQDNKEDASTEQTQKAKKKQGLVTLDVTKDYPEKKIVLQDLADVKYIPLETKKNALLTNSTAMLGYVSDSLIVAFTLEKEIVLFNGDGSVRSSFSHAGQGSKEYQYIIGMAVDPKAQEIFIVDYLLKYRMQVYSFTGQYKRTLPIPYKMILNSLQDFSADCLLACDMDVNQGISNRAKPYMLLSKKTGEIVYGTGLCLDSEEKLLEYLAFLKGRHDDPKSEKSQAFQEFMILLERARKIIAAMYQEDEEENGGKKIWKPENISASDLEKVICSGIPINKMGNLKKMSASILAKHFSQKRFSRQRINNILNHKFPVERFDLITLEFFVISQEMAEDDPYTRYRHFLEEIQEILARCEMSEIYIVNPYECFLLMCLLTDCPLAVFSEIWEKSYEEGEEKN